jgi:hypothetical protein
MLSEAYTNKVGVFDFRSLAAVFSRIEKTGTTSEVDDMLLTSVISTHLLYFQFIENHNEEFKTEKLKNLKIIEDF